MSNEKEPYIGSVLFYKHLIIGIVFFFVIVTTILSILLSVMNAKLSNNITKTNDEIHLLQGEMNQMQVNEIRKEQRQQKNVKPDYDKESWELVLVNGTHAVANDYPVDLVVSKERIKVDQRIEEALDAMLSAMRAEGLKPFAYSGYRSIEDQAAMFEKSVNEKMKGKKDYTQAFFETKHIYTLPGSSEHHTGLAVDILSEDYKVLDEKQAETNEAKWLETHCAEYGFILRYPQNKKNITGVEYHPWHFRYVGVEVAAYIMEHGITLEEFLYEE